MGLLDRTIEKWADAAIKGRGSNTIRGSLLIVAAAGCVALGVWLARAEGPRAQLGEQAAALVALVPLVLSLGLLVLAAASLAIGVLALVRTGKWG